MQCSVCFEAWSIIVTSKENSSIYSCTRCLRDKKEFSVRKHLFLLHFQSRRCYKRHIASLPHDVQKVAVLLHLTSDVPAITFSAKVDNICHNFKVCRGKVLNANIKFYSNADY